MTIERAFGLTALSMPLGSVGTFAGIVVYIVASRDSLPVDLVVRYSALGGLVSGALALAFFGVFAAMT